MDNGKAVVTDAELIEPGTPLPWRYSNKPGYIGLRIEADGWPRPVATTCKHPDVYYTHIRKNISGEEVITFARETQEGETRKAEVLAQEEANARYIVHACNEYPKLLARLQALSDAAGAMEAALESARGWFLDYERQHRLKFTGEGNLKADVNADRAAFLGAALTKYREARDG